MAGTIRYFPSLPLLLIDRPDGPVMLVGLDVPVIRSPRSPFEPPGQGGRREGRDQEEGNKTSAHCGSPCVVPPVLNATTSKSLTWGEQSIRWREQDNNLEPLVTALRQAAGISH